MKKQAEETISSVLDLKELLENGQCVLTKNDQEDLIVLDYEKYQYLLQVLEMQEDNANGTLTLNQANPVGVKIVSDQDIELSDEEFEQLKEQLIEALETSFKHKEKRKEELS